MGLSRVCVYAASSTGRNPAYTDAARSLGTCLAAREIGLVYGGASVGLMGEVADAALDAGGEVIGVLPEQLEGREIGHRGLSELRIVGSMHERKATMAELADAFVALPGGLGTLEELIEVATWTQLGLHTKPVGLFDVRGYWDSLEHLLDHAVRERFLHPGHRGLLLSARSADVLLDRLTTWEPAQGEKWLAGDGRIPDSVPPRGPLVGTSAIVVRDGRVLLGRRKGAHGAATWSFAGGKVDAGESPERSAARELEEETGLIATRVTPVTWTNDAFDDDGLHYITLHHLVEATGEPEIREPDKVADWSWHSWDALPAPLFEPVAALAATGWRPPETP